MVIWEGQLIESSQKHLGPEESNKTHMIRWSLEKSGSLLGSNNRNLVNFLITKMILHRKPRMMQRKTRTTRKNLLAASTVINQDQMTMAKMVTTLPMTVEMDINSIKG